MVRLMRSTWLWLNRGAISVTFCGTMAFIGASFHADCERRLAVGKFHAIDRLAAREPFLDGDPVRVAPDAHAVVRQRGLVSDDDPWLASTDRQRGDVEFQLFEADVFQQLEGHCAQGLGAPFETLLPCACRI